jgi:hypothetical protein
MTMTRCRLSNGSEERQVHEIEIRQGVIYLGGPQLVSLDEGRLPW